MIDADCGLQKVTAGSKKERAPRAQQITPPGTHSAAMNVPFPGTRRELVAGRGACILNASRITHSRCFSDLTVARFISSTCPKDDRISSVNLSSLLASANKEYMVAVTSVAVVSLPALVSNVAFEYNYSSLGSRLALVIFHRLDKHRLSRVADCRVLSALLVAFLV